MKPTWERDGIQLRLGDCCEVMRALADNSVSLIVADPPYGIGYHSNHYKDKNPHAPITNDWNFQIGLFLNECHRILIDGGALYLFCRWDVQPLWLPYVNASGLKTKTSIVWVKDNWSAGDLYGSFGNQYEQIMFIAKGKHKIRGRRWPNVWPFPRVPAKKMLHPTQKPVALLERAIAASSDAGDLVLDPFSGSGSTGAACQNLGRKCLLIDVDKRMIELSARRLGIDVPVAQQRQQEPDPAVFSYPSPDEWGVHPEDMRAILDLMTGNVNRVELEEKSQDAAVTPAITKRGDAVPQSDTMPLFAGVDE